MKEGTKKLNEKLTENSTLILWIRYPWVRIVPRYHRCVAVRAIFRVSIVRFVQIHDLAQSYSVQIVLNYTELYIIWNYYVLIISCEKEFIVGFLRWMPLILNTYEIQMECHRELPFFHQTRLICYLTKWKGKKISWRKSEQSNLMI